MQFKRTFLYRAIMQPVDYAKEACLYNFMLAAPFILMWLVIAIPISVLFDILITCEMFLKS